MTLLPALIRRRPAQPSMPDLTQQAVRLPAPRLARLHPYRWPALVVLLAAAGIAATWLASTEAIEAAGDAAAWLAVHDTTRGRAVASTLLAAVGALACVAGWWRATSPRRPVRLADGRGTIEVGEVSARLAAMLLERHDVRAARVVVQNRHRRGVSVSAQVDVTPDARLRETLEAAGAAARELFHERLGVPMMAAPVFGLHYDELDLRPVKTRT